jgi:hypothetical protein
MDSGEDMYVSFVMPLYCQLLTFLILYNGTFRMAVALLMKCSHRSRTRKPSWEKRVAKKGVAKEGVANIENTVAQILREFFFTIPMRRTFTRKVYISLIVIVPPHSWLSLLL